MENCKEGPRVARLFQRTEGISGETSKNNLRELAMLAWKSVFFFHYLGTVHSAMPDAHIFHHTNYISGVKISSTLIFCSALFIILSKLILYYALRMKKNPHKCYAYLVILFHTITVAYGVYSSSSRIHLITYNN